MLKEMIRNQQQHRQRHSRDDNDIRLISQKQKERTILHQFIHHKRCKLCSTKFLSGYCHNCCTPMCQHFFNNNNKKFQKNFQHHQQGEKNLNNRLPSSTTSIIMTNIIDSNNFNSKNLAQNQKINQPVKHNSMSILTPSAPSIGHDLYMNEKQSDLVFLVGKEKNNIWRFPGHSEYLKNISPYFQTIINDKNNNNINEINIDWCDPDIFEIILKYAYLDELIIINNNHCSIEKILKLFIAANNFKLFSLSKYCLTFLMDQCNNETVLDIIIFMKNYFPLKKLTINDELIESLIKLLNYCFDIIDRDCQKILTSDKFFSIQDKELIRSILSRDTLNIDNESIIYDAINKWSKQQCKQQRLELIADNQRFLINDLLYLTRYLLMTLDEFLMGPYRDPLLSDEDKELFIKCIQDPSVDVPERYKQYKLRHSRHYNQEIDCDKTTTTKPRLMKSFSYEKGFTDKPNLKKPKQRSVQKKIVKGFFNVMILIIRVLD